MLEKVKIFGIPLHRVGTAELQDFIVNAVEKKIRARIYYLNLHGAVLGGKWVWYANLFRQADLVFCDGDGIRWGLKILGKLIDKIIEI